MKKKEKIYKSYEEYLKDRYPNDLKHNEVECLDGEKVGEKIARDSFEKLKSQFQFA